MGMSQKRDRGGRFARTRSFSSTPPSTASTPTVPSSTLAAAPEVTVTDLYRVYTREQDDQRRWPGIDFGPYDD